jgi:hypothetical protein
VASGASRNKEGRRDKKKVEGTKSPKVRRATGTIVLEVLHYYASKFRKMPEKRVFPFWNLDGTINSLNQGIKITRR